MSSSSLMRLMDLGSSFSLLTEMAYFASYLMEFLLYSPFLKYSLSTIYFCSGPLLFEFELTEVGFLAAAELRFWVELAFTNCFCKFFLTVLIWLFDLG